MRTDILYFVVLSSLAACAVEPTPIDPDAGLEDASAVDEPDAVVRIATGAIMRSMAPVDLPVLKQAARDEDAGEPCDEDE